MCYGELSQVGLIQRERNSFASHMLNSGFISAKECKGVEAFLVKCTDL